MEKKPIMAYSENLFENYTSIPRQAEKRALEWPPNLECIESEDLPELIIKLKNHLRELETLNEELKRTISELAMRWK